MKNSHRHLLSTVQALKISLEDAHDDAPGVADEVEDLEDDLGSNSSLDSDVDDFIETIDFYVGVLMDLVPSMERIYLQSLQQKSVSPIVTEGNSTTSIRLPSIDATSLKGKEIGAEFEIQEPSARNEAPNFTKTMTQTKTLASEDDAEWGRDLRVQFKGLFNRRKLNELGQSRKAPFNNMAAGGMYSIQPGY